MHEIEDVGSYDAIIISSGMAGLMAGNALVKKDQRVLMLEKHVIPGGYTTFRSRCDHTPGAFPENSPRETSEPTEAKSNPQAGGAACAWSSSAAPIRAPA